jgi:hypothetical protein
MLLILCLGASVSRLWGGPPYITDDPEIPPLHGWEINLPFTLTRYAGHRVMQTPLLDINFGFTSDMAFNVEFPVAGIVVPASQAVTGIGDTLVAVKWRFVREGKDRPQVAVCPQVILPTGDSGRGLGAGEPLYLLSMMGEKNLGIWTAYANVSHVWQQTPNHRDYWYYGIVITRKFSRRLEVGAEIVGNTAIHVNGPADSGFNLGAEWTLHKGYLLMVSAGRSFRDTGALFQFYFGFQLLIAGERMKTT